MLKKLQVAMIGRISNKNINVFIVSQKNNIKVFIERSEQKDIKEDLFYILLNFLKQLINSMEFKKFLILDSCMNYKYFILIQLINLILKKLVKKEQ